MRLSMLVAAALFCAGVWRVGSAQTPAPTPRPPIRIGRPAGGPSPGSNTSTSPPAGGQSATLVCRMGGNMVWTLVNQFGLVETQLGGKNMRVPVALALFDQLKFARGKAPAQPDGSNLDPGTCSFRDRGMTAADPDTVVCDADGFVFNETVQWGNGSTLGGETTMSGGSLSFQNKQPFSMQVTLWGGIQWKVVAGTKPKAIK